LAIAVFMGLSDITINHALIDRKMRLKVIFVKQLNDRLAMTPENNLQLRAA
jgi:hypothetical protein